MGYSNTFDAKLNFLQFKLKHLNLIENSSEKYNPKVDEKIIKQTFMSRKY